jgi:hypothetical protein
MGPVHYDQEPSMYMGGPGAPPPLTLGLPSNYGAPIYLQQPMTASGPYNYGSSINKVTSYNPLPRPSAYAPTGLSYGAPPVLDSYGMDMDMSLGLLVHLLLALAAITCLACEFDIFVQMGCFQIVVLSY